MVEWFKVASPTMAAMEQVKGYVPREREGVARWGSPGAHMLQLGRVVGMFETLLAVNHIPYEEVAPISWQAAIGAPIKKKSETYQQHKSALNKHAKALFPNEKQVTLETCDALLIAYYALAKHKGAI
jgi:hypothetical protein